MSDLPDFGKILFSPPVLLIGGGLGLVILLIGSRGASSAPSNGAADPNTLSATVQMNQIASSNAVSMAQISAQAGAATQQVNLQEQGQILGYLENTNNNNTLLNQTIMTSTAGITNNQITSSTAMGMDILNNQNRLQFAQQAAAVSADQTQGAVNIATIQASAAKSVAKTNAIAGVLGSAIAGATKVATAGVGF